MSYAYTAYVHIVVGLKFIVRLCTDLGLKDAQEYICETKQQVDIMTY